MTPEDIGLKLRGARERLCVVQGEVARQGGSVGDPLVEWLGDAVTIIDRVGVILDPLWSTANEPGVADQTVHEVCAFAWRTAGGLSLHRCGSPAGHGMEHRCSCGELYPS